MKWITIIWSMVAGASLAMALSHLLIAAKQRSAWVHILFAMGAIAVAETARSFSMLSINQGFGELAMMHAQTTEQIARALRWLHVPPLCYWLSFLASSAFISGLRESGWRRRLPRLPGDAHHHFHEARQPQLRSSHWAPALQVFG
jgi:hypothetical protein